MHKKISIEKIYELIEMLDKMINIEHKKILVVFDIDDTLIRPITTLGSDSWFRHSITEMSENVHDIIDKIYYIYSLLSFQIVENDTYKLFDAITTYANEKDLKFFALTSRNTKFYSFTIKHLEDANIANVIIRDNMLNVDNFLNLTIDDFCNNDIRYIDNICLISGNNKGKVLTKLLNSHCKNTLDRFDTIIFIDDMINNINDVHDSILANDIYNDIETYCIHYKFMEHHKSNYSIHDITDNKNKIEEIFRMKNYINS